MERTEPTTRRWAANAPEQFCWGSWQGEEETVLFHQGSGDTLMLNPLGEFLLRRLQDHQLTHAELTRSAADYFEIEKESGLAESILSSLHTFRSLGLVVSDIL